MSSGEVRKVSRQDLQLVQNLIERCIQLYMSKKEVVSTLLHQAKIEPSFTKLVWQKLEVENQDFFKAYRFRLVLKDQITKFNELLQKQADLMRQISSDAGAASVPIPLYNTGQSTRLENTHQSTVANLRNGLTNDGPSVHPNMQSGVGTSGLPRRDDVSQNLRMGQNSNIELIQGTNVEGMIKSEQPSFMYNPVNNVPSVEPDTSSYGFLGQIPRNFSLSDLTADFNISSDILDNYSRSPYLAENTDFLNPHGNGDIQGQCSTHVDRTLRN